MKKFAILSLVIILLTSGCGKKSPEDLVAKFTSSIENSKSYLLKGNMEILSNEETFTYSLEVSFLKDNFYKVNLVNQTNNHEQIILKNNEGVYVVTPALNKSFKFQSDWPNNSSQSYILSSLVKDIKNDEEKTIENTDKGHIIRTKVNYPNNKELTYQKIYFDKNMNLESIEVYNSEDIVTIKAVFSKLDLKASLEESDFALDKLIDVNKTNDKEECTNEECDEKTSNIIDNIIYPLYIPRETYLSNSEKVDTDTGNRVILTFAGDKNFILIEEAASVSSDFEVIPVYGEPVMLSDTIAAKSANSLTWTSEGLSYYLTSSDLSTDEMVTIAESLGNTKSVAGTK